LNRQLLDAVVQNVETPAENALDGGGGVAGSVTAYVRTWASPGLAAIGVVCWHASIGQIHPYSIGIIGLVSQLPVLWWLGLVLVLVAVALELPRDPPRLLARVVPAISVALVPHATLSASETTPRFDAAYDVAGFAQYVGQHGRTLPYLDARMSWPGVLSGTGMLAQAMHVPTLWFVRWAPLFMNLAYLLPVKAIANASLRTSRARWAVLPIFLVSNWIDQDYFSPQAIDLLLFLTIVAIVIRTFGARGEQPKVVRMLMATPAYQAVSAALPRLLGLPSGAPPGEMTVDDTTTVQRAASLGLVLLLTAAVVVSHQFTPLALCLVLVGLAVAGRTRLKALWLLVLVLVFAWLSWEAEIYWAGHLDVVFGGVGNFGTLLGSSVTTRLAHVSSARLEVQWARLAASLVTWLGGFLGLWVLWRRGRTQWTLAIMLVFPVIVAGGVNYGGEISLRLLLFSLAPCSILIAGLLDASPLRWLAAVSCILVVGLLLALFPLTRYGNEVFEAIAPGDVKAANWIHDHVPVGQTVWVVNGDSPLDSAGIGRYHFALLPGPTFTSEAAYDKAIHSVSHGDWIYLSRSEGEYGVVFQGDFPGNWIQDFVFWLIGTKLVGIAYQTSTAYVLHVVGPTPHIKPAR